MRDLLILLIHLITTVARLASPGGVRSVVAESVLVKHQLLILSTSVEVRRNQRYLAGVMLPTLMLELGHESLAVTQDYLADVRKPGEAKKAVADADFIPKPKVVKTGTDGN